MTKFHTEHVILSCCKKIHDSTQVNNIFWSRINSTQLFNFAYVCQLLLL